MQCTVQIRLQTSQVRSACLNTNLHLSPAWSMGLHPGFGPDRHQGESTETHRACALGGRRYVKRCIEQLLGDG